MLITPALHHDFDAIWPEVQRVMQEGCTYALSRELTKEQAFAYFFPTNGRTYVAKIGEEVVGIFMLKPNFAGPAAHIANAAFIVAKEAEGKGIARAMGTYALEIAAKLGYKAMQFNFVVSNNQPAVHLWKSLGFSIIGTIPEAFDHPEAGMVEAYIMYRKLS